MIYDFLEGFKEAYKVRGNDMILDNYKLEEGLYIKIDSNDNWDYLIVNKEIEMTDLYEWFKKADFYSVYLNSNKSVPSNLFDESKNKSSNSKKIQSNNYLSWFIKKDVLIVKDSKDYLPIEKIKEITGSYYENLISKNLNSKEIIAIIGDNFDEEKYLYCKNTIIERIEKIIDFAESKTSEYKKYIKVFFDFGNFELYERESNRYLYHKVFTTDKYNLKIDKSTYGLSNLNMGLNSKKPYLEHKTMQNSIPFRITLEEAILLYRYSIWLKSQGYGIKFEEFNYNYETPLFGMKEESLKNKDYKYFNLSNNNGEIEIRDYEIIPSCSNKSGINIQNHLDKKMKVEEVQITRTYDDYNQRYKRGVESSINEFLFNKNLIRNYKKESSDIKPDKYINKRLINILLLSRDMIFDYVYKGCNENIFLFCNKFGLELVKNTLNTKGIDSASDAFNLYYSIKKSNKGGVNMPKISEIKSSILQKMKNPLNEDFDNIEEYSFAAGQIIYYILSKSKAQKKNHDMIEPMMSRKKVSDLNQELKFWFSRYSHAIRQGDRRFNKLFSMVISYDFNAQKNDDMFLAGYLANNMMYEKEEENNEI